MSAGGEYTSSANGYMTKVSHLNKSKHSQGATASTLVHMTDARSKPPQLLAPAVRRAKYQLNVRSSVSKFNAGKIEKLGTF